MISASDRILVVAPHADERAARERPDDEPNMLVCDCMIGYHIYCLSPPMQKVPDEDWKCPTCAKKK